MERALGREGARTKKSPYSHWQVGIEFVFIDSASSGWGTCCLQHLCVVPRLPSESF